MSPEVSSSRISHFGPRPRRHIPPLNQMHGADSHQCVINSWFSAIRAQPDIDAWHSAWPPYIFIRQEHARCQNRHR
jgi:hypothetical protein